MRKTYLALMLIPVALAVGGLGDGYAAQHSPSGLEVEIRRSRVLPLPLVPAQRQVRPDDDRALIAALAAFARRADGEDWSLIEQFVAERPVSRWSPVLWAILCLGYRQAGRDTRGLAALQRAWDLSKDSPGPEIETLAVGVGAELAELLAGIGRTEELRVLLAELERRRLRGANKGRIASIRQGLLVMDADPSRAFVCGPLSLLRILTLSGGDPEAKQLLQDARSRRDGVSLTELEQLASQVHLRMRMAFRSPGHSEIPLPAVMNLRVQHSVALTKKEGGCYVAFDPSFNTETCLSTLTINDESSGYFLIPGDELPVGWHAVTTMEGWGVWGR